MIADQDAEEQNLVRVIDESGEEYLYPSAYFLEIGLPQRAMSALSRKSA